MQDCGDCLLHRPAEYVLVLCKVLAENIWQVNSTVCNLVTFLLPYHHKTPSTPCRHCVYAVDSFPHAHTNASQPCQLQQVFAEAAYDDKHSGTSLPRCRTPLGLEATRADKMAPAYDKKLPAEGPSLSPCTPTYLQETPKRQPAGLQVVQGWAPSWLGKQSSSCLQHYDGDAASTQHRMSTSGGAVQKCSIVRFDTKCAMCSSPQQSGIEPPNGQPKDGCQQSKLRSRVGDMRPSSKCNKFALRPPSGRALRTKETIGTLSRDCTAVLHKAGARATGEAFSLHAWCASVDAASSTPADRHAITDVYASRKRTLRRTIVQLAAGTQEPHDVPYNSRKRRKLVSKNCSGYGV